MAAALFTPSWVACGSTVDVGFESGAVVPLFDAGASVDAGLAPIRECGTKQAATPCGAAEVVDCAGPGPQLVTRIEPLDCDITRGFTGVPEELTFGCQDAFDGQSGDGCSGDRICVRRSLVGCCLELAACHGDDEPLLLRSRACAQNCLVSSPTVERAEVYAECGSFLSALDRLGDPYRLLGAPCRGNFVCGEGVGEVIGRELPFTPELQIFFCVGQQIQILNALPWFSVPQPGPDAGADAGWPEAGWPDAGWPEAGWPDAGWADAGWADAGAGDAGLADAGAVDAGDAEPGKVTLAP